MYVSEKAQAFVKVAEQDEELSAKLHDAQRTGFDVAAKAMIELAKEAGYDLDESDFSFDDPAEE
ncbi:MAG: Nif11-like leader peptide family natural product precursor [Coriobacteriales bacterium]|jgi:hypothetical protein